MASPQACPYGHQVNKVVARWRVGSLPRCGVRTRLCPGPGLPQPQLPVTTVPSRRDSRFGGNYERPRKSPRGWGRRPPLLRRPRGRMPSRARLGAALPAWDAGGEPRLGKVEGGQRVPSRPGQQAWSDQCLTDLMGSRGTPPQRNFRILPLARPPPQAVCSGIRSSSRWSQIKKNTHKACVQMGEIRVPTTLLCPPSRALELGKDPAESSQPTLSLYTLERGRPERASDSPKVTPRRGGPQD